MAHKENPSTETDRLDRHIGQRLRRLRVSRRITRDNLASALEIPAPALAEYEAGARPLSSARLMKAASLLDAPFTGFFQGFDQRPQANDKPAAGLDGVTDKTMRRALVRLVRALAKR